MLLYIAGSLGIQDLCEVGAPGLCSLLASLEDWIGHKHANVGGIQELLIVLCDVLALWCVFTTSFESVESDTRVS